MSLFTSLFHTRQFPDSGSGAVVEEGSGQSAGWVEGEPCIWWWRIRGFMPSEESGYLGKLQPIAYRLAIVNATLGDRMIRYSPSTFLCEFRRKIKVSEVYTGWEGNWTTEADTLIKSYNLFITWPCISVLQQGVDTANDAQLSCVDWNSV